MSIIGDTTLRLDEEQAMLLDYARAFCRDRGGSAVARLQLERQEDLAPELWRSMVEMGWTGIGVPEALGGSGLGIGAAVPVLESLGGALLGGPLTSSLLASQLLLRADAEGTQETLVARLAGGVRAAVALLEDGDWGAQALHASVDASGRLHGHKCLVMDAVGAEVLLVAAMRGDTPVLALVESPALPAAAVTACELIDLTHRAADIQFDGVEITALVEGAAVAPALRDYRLLGALLVAAETTGSSAACLATVVEYLRTRKQFGRLIGSYQALKHPAVDMLTRVDNSRSFIYHAAALVGDAPLSRDSEMACRMAKAQATDTIRFTADRAVQFHGGMGFTWDCDAQLYLRRAQWAQQQFGDAQHHRRRLAALLLD